MELSGEKDALLVGNVGSEIDVERLFKTDRKDTGKRSTAESDLADDLQHV